MTNPITALAYMLAYSKNIGGAPKDIEKQGDASSTRYTGRRVTGLIAIVQKISAIEFPFRPRWPGVREYIVEGLRKIRPLRVTIPTADDRTEIFESVGLQHRLRVAAWFNNNYERGHEFLLRLAG